MKPNCINITIAVCTDLAKKAVENKLKQNYQGSWIFSPVNTQTLE